MHVPEGQISFFDPVEAPAAERPKCLEGYECLYEKSYRCRNERTCPEGMRFVEYTGSTVKQCIEATVEEYQDGFIHCPIIDFFNGCEWCYERLNSDDYVFVRDKTQNYKRFPRKEAV